MQLTILAFSPASHFQVRLPSGYLNLVVHIRDRLNCLTEYHLSSIDVLSSPIETQNILFLTGNQNKIEQVISLKAQELNQMNFANIQNAVSSKYLLIRN